MKAIYLACAGLLALMMGSCKPEGDGRPTLLVSVEPQRTLLREIAGPGYNVVTLLSAGANPENFEPTMATRTSAEGAKAYFMTGGEMPFEQTLAQTLPPSVRMVDASRGIELLHGTHCHDHADGHHHHGDIDPHTWTSVRNMRIMAANMLAELQSLEPDSAAQFQARWQKLDQRLDSLDRALTARLATASRAFAVWHPSLSYFAHDYGLEQIAVGADNKEMSPRHLAEVTAEARADSVRVLFFQREYDTRQAQRLNSQMGTRLVTINPLDGDWEHQMDIIADALTADK